MVNSLKLIIKQMNMNFKSILGNWVNLIYLSFFVLIALLIPVIFIPLNMSVSISFSILLISVNSVLFANLNYNLRNSTLRRNLDLSKSNRFTFNLSIYFTLFIFSIIASTLLYVIFKCLADIGCILVAWQKYSSDSTFIFNFTFDLFLLVVYYTVIMCTIIYSISFLLNYLINSKKSYFTVMLSLIILTIIFGGSFNEYFFYYAGTGLDFAEGPLYPRSIYWFSFIFPFYGPGELISIAFDVSKIYRDTGNPYDYVPISFFNLNDYVFELIWGKSSIDWRLLMMVPYVEIAGLVLAGGLVSKYKKG